MPDFAIITQKGGIAENIPIMLLSEAFMAKGSGQDVDWLAMGF